MLPLEREGGRETNREREERERRERMRVNETTDTGGTSFATRWGTIT